MEEYLARHVQEEIFFTWVVSPTVIFGRHQVIEAEVNIDYCEAHGIAMYRRKSGGGCVYADEGNLMMSLISPDKHSEQVFQSFLDRVSDVLQSLGLPAVKSEHNDIMVDGYKVSGNACYALPTGTIVHGTLLVDVNFDVLQQAITPSVQKLAKHGVQSVRQRVANLVDYVAFADVKTIDNINTHLINALCARARALTSEEIEAIDEIEKSYLLPRFIAGK
jgi:lipoic acid synthetase/lipoate-protein ligase A